MLHWLLWIPPALAMVGLYILTRMGSEVAVDVVGALRVRLRGRATRALFGLIEQEADGGANSTDGLRVSLSPAAWACLGLGCVLAVLWHHSVLSPWFIVFGAGAAWMLVATRGEMGREDLRELETFISSLRSVFSVGQSIFLSLDVAGVNGFAHVLDGGVPQDGDLAGLRIYLDVDHVGGEGVARGRAVGRAAAGDGAAGAPLTGGDLLEGQRLAGVGPAHQLAVDELDVPFLYLQLLGGPQAHLPLHVLGGLVAGQTRGISGAAAAGTGGVPDGW